MKEGHLPVLAEEVMSMLAPASGSLQIDATLGGGGHTERILEATDPDGRLLGLDADGAAIARVRARLVRFGDRLVLRQANFRELAAVAPAAGFDVVDGLLFDLGLSSFQLADSERGFGIRTGGPLDMRFDTGRGIPAADLLATLDATELTAFFRRYGEEPQAGRIARAIVEARRSAPIGTAEELAALVERVAPGAPRGRRRIHPATRVFQALRIAVNAELDALEEALAAAVDLLRPGGRLVVLSYHSLEDRIVKRFMEAERKGCICPPAVPVCVCGRTPGCASSADRSVRRPRRSRSTREPAAPGSVPPSGSPHSQTQSRADRSPDPRPAAVIEPSEGGGPAMSKRHQSSRRRAYGRRQHELRERTDRRAELPDDDFGAGLAEPSGDGFSFFELDLAPRRLSFAAGD